MRLWTLHPKYLDRQGLLALWREGLLAQAVLAGKTKGYRNHPQLIRFKSARDPLAAIGCYLTIVHREAASAATVSTVAESQNRTGVRKSRLPGVRWNTKPSTC